MPEILPINRAKAPVKRRRKDQRINLMMYSEEWVRYQDVCASEGTDPSKDIRSFISKRIKK